jgi:CBS domain-containing protein
MNKATILRQGTGTKFLLSELSGAAIVLRDRKIGKLDDFIILDEGPLPHVTHLVVHRAFGYPSLVIPLELIERIGTDRILVDIDAPSNYETPVPEDAILLKDYVLDKKVIDLEDREVSVVFDVKLLWIPTTRRVYVSDVEFGRRGFFRRLGLGWFANLLNVEDDSVSWSYIQPLPESIGSFKGNVKLKALKEQIEDMPPVDLADILEELEPVQREAVFKQLDSEEASDALEEIDPNVQRQIVSSMEGDAVAKLVDLMTPPQAADLLAVIPYDEKQKILGHLGEEFREKINAIMDKQEESILNYATDRYISLPAATLVGYVEDNYALLAKDKDVAMYFYVLGEENVVVGVVDIREILLADPGLTLEEIMADRIVSLEPEQTLRDAYELFRRYGFRAIPILDEGKRNLGVIVYKDVMGLKHRFVA